VFVPGRAPYRALRLYPVLRAHSFIEGLTLESPARRRRYMIMKPACTCPSPMSDFNHFSMSEYFATTLSPSTKPLPTANFQNSSRDLPVLASMLMAYPLNVGLPKSGLSRRWSSYTLRRPILTTGCFRVPFFLHQLHRGSLPILLEAPVTTTAAPFGPNPASPRKAEGPECVTARPLRRPEC